MKNFSIKLIFVIVGTLCLGGGFYLDHLAKESIEKSLRTTGEVIELKSSSSDLRSKAPVVRFNTKNGQQIIFRSHAYSRPPRFEVGDKVGVFYRPENPKMSAKVDTFFSMRGAPFVMYILGTFFVILGLLLGLLLKR